MKEFIFASFILILSSGAKAVEEYPGKVRNDIYESIARDLSPFKECITFASSAYDVNEFILLSVFLVEQGYKAPLRKNNNGTLDHGLGQINSVREDEIKNIGLTLADVAANPCKNILATAYILQTEIKEAGDTWTGVANYHYDINGNYPQHHHNYRQRIISRFLSLVSVAQRNI